jgi:hypothetical protein
LLQATLLTRLQIEAVFLDVLTDAFALNLSAEAAEGFLERLVLSDGDEDQRKSPNSSGTGSRGTDTPPMIGFDLLFRRYYSIVVPLANVKHIRI